MKTEFETIKGHCMTNLDYYDCPVSEFYRVPNIGERVMVVVELHKLKQLES